MNGPLKCVVCCAYAAQHTFKIGHRKSVAVDARLVQLQFVHIRHGQWAGSRRSRRRTISVIQSLRHPEAHARHMEGERENKKI